MDLWIRSQDKERLGKIIYIEYAKDDYGHHLIGWRDKFDGTRIATYKTKERALEVLDEIQKKINLVCLGHDFGSPMIDLKNPTYIYEMPKE